MSDTTHAPSRGTESSGLRRYALAGYRWLLLAFLLAGVAVIVLVLGVIARPGVLAVVLSGVLVVQTTLLQSLLAGLADNAALYGGLGRDRPGCDGRGALLEESADNPPPSGNSWPRCISAPWKHCRTSPSTRARPARRPACPAPTAASASPSPTTEPGLTPRPPGMAPAYRDGRLAGRARRRSPRPLTARGGNDPPRRAPGFRTWLNPGPFGAVMARSRSRRAAGRAGAGLAATR